MTQGKRLIAIGLGVWGLIGAFNNDAFWLLNGADLLFHEAGHVFLAPFGETIAMLGGTLFQLLFPAGLAVAFWIQEKLYSASVMAWWTGQNCFHIAPYVKDARSEFLPLVGGGIHDWSYLLEKWHLLEHDQTIGGAFWLAGLSIITLATTAAFLFASEE